jgi:signal transduction histidine kinase
MLARRNVKAEWWITHLRWAILASILVLSSIDPLQTGHRPIVYALVLAAAAYNLGLVLLLHFKLTPPYLLESGLALDTALFIGVTYFSAQPAYLLLSLFPVTVAVLRFGFEISILVASIVTSAYGVTIFLMRPSLVTGGGLVPTIISMMAPFVVAIAGGLLIFRQKTLQESAELEVPPSAAYRERFRAIYQMTGELIATLNYRLILEKMLDVSIADFKEGADRSFQKALSMVLLLSEGKKELYVAGSRNLSKRDELQRISGEGGLVGQVISTAEPAIRADPRSDPELSRFHALRRCRSVLCVPLRAGLDMYGVALFASPEPDAYSEAYMELVTAFCNQASIALQNAELYQTLQEEKQRILVSDTELRKQLARELHDGPTQTVSSVAMRLDFVRMLMENDPKRARLELDNLERLAAQAVKEVRTMLFSMRPMILETQGLAPALTQYAEHIKETDKIDVHVDAERLDKRPVPHVEGAVFFILEEAINNARKHAEPRNIWISLERRNGELLAQVRDDGHGFDVMQVEGSYDQRTSLGLVNMRERASLISGSLSIESKPGEGTKVTLRVPMSGQEEPGW